MRHVVLTTVAVVLAAGTVVTGAAYFFERPTVLRVAVPRKSDDSALIGAFQQAFQADKKNIRLELVPVENFADSAATLESGKADVAVVRTDIKMPLKSQTLLILYHEAAVLMVPHGSKVTTINALKGTRVGVLKGRVSAPGNAALLGTVTAQYNVAPGGYKIVEMAPEDMPKALQKKEIDAVFAVGVPQSKFLSETVKAFTAVAGAPDFIPVSEADLIADHSPAVESVTVSAGTFGGSPRRPTDDFDTASVSVRLMTMSSMDDAVAANLLRHMFYERPQIAAAVPLAMRLEPPATDKGQALPVHTGAAAYLDGNELTFLDRYSDFMYLGAMLMSAVGSSLAAVSTRMGLKMCRHVDTHLQRLLEMLRAAREAKDAKTLNQIEAETDLIMASVLHRDKIRGLQGHRASAFSLALSHVRAAINDRRLQLHTTGPRLAVDNVIPLEELEEAAAS